MLFLHLFVRLSVSENIIMLIITPIKYFMLETSPFSYIINTITIIITTITFIIINLKSTITFTIISIITIIISFTMMMMMMMMIIIIIIIIIIIPSVMFSFFDIRRSRVPLVYEFICVLFNYFI